MRWARGFAKLYPSSLSMISSSCTREARESRITQVFTSPPLSSAFPNIHLVALCLGATGPLYAGYMLAGGYSWRLFFYVEIAFAGALFVLAFFFVEETAYKRKLPTSPAPSTPSSQIGDKETNTVNHLERNSDILPDRKTFTQQLKLFHGIDKDAEFFLTMIRPFTYFTVPAVFWVITTYGKLSKTSLLTII